MLDFLGFKFRVILNLHWMLWWSLGLSITFCLYPTHHAYESFDITHLGNKAQIFPSKFLNSRTTREQLVVKNEYRMSTYSFRGNYSLLLHELNSCRGKYSRKYGKVHIF